MRDAVVAIEGTADEVVTGMVLRHVRVDATSVPRNSCPDACRWCVRLIASPAPPTLFALTPYDVQIERCVTSIAHAAVPPVAR